MSWARTARGLEEMTSDPPMATATVTRVGRTATPPLKRLCALREKRGQRDRGRRCLVGYVDGRKLVIFENTNGATGGPSWTASLSEPKDPAA